jgi:ribosomal protein L22
VIVLGVGDRRVEQLCPVLGDAARREREHSAGFGHRLAANVVAFAPRGVAKDWAKLLDSAIANAENNHELVGDELHITSVYADEGPTLKRFTPRAMGRATPIHKRTSHLTIMLGPKE